MRPMFQRPWILPIVLGAAVTVSADDWPCWRGPERTGVVNESSGWPSGWPPKRLWHANVGFGCSSTIIVAGRLYATGWLGQPPGRRPGGGDNPIGTETVYCFDVSSGLELWRQSYPCRYQGRLRTGDLNAYGGPSSTPTLDPDSGRLYTLSVDGRLSCWNVRASGSPLWNVDMYDAFGAGQRPDVGGGRRDYGYPGAPYLLGRAVVVEVGADEGLLMGFDGATGRRLWTSRAHEPAGHTAGPVALDVAGMPCLAILALRGLCVVRSDAAGFGETLVTHPWATDFACNIPSPVAVAGGVLLTSGYNHRCMVRLAVKGDGIRAVWTTREHAVVGTPIVYDDRIYTIAGRLHCNSLSTGESLWSGGSFEHGTGLVTKSDRKLIVFGARRLALIDIARGATAYRELSRLDNLVSGICYPHVTLANGILACKDRDGNLVCLTVKAKP